jgi:hypothetical protein
MKNVKITLFCLTIGIYAYSQTIPQGSPPSPAATTAQKANAAWYRGGNTNANGNNNLFGTAAGFNSPIYTQTNGINRMKLNGDFAYTINGFNQNRNGYLLLGQDGAFGSGGTIYGNRGAYSLLHLNGAGNGLQEGGYRSWMQTGITFTSNDDLAYIGHRRMGANDITDMVVAWSDNSQSSGVGPDNLVFNFTAGSGLGTDDLAGDNPNGREIMRLTPIGNVGVGPRFSNANQPASLFHVNNNNFERSFIQITNQIGTGQTFNDGLHLGYDVTGATTKIAEINQKENDILWIKSNKIPRITVSHTGAITPGFNSNPGGLATDLTRVGVGVLYAPLSMLHIGQDLITPANTQTGWRSWMDIGTLSSTSIDQMFVGLKDEQNGVVSGFNFDAVINWGQNNTNGPLNIAPDNLRFIFTSVLGSNGKAGTANGLEVARMEPIEASTMSGNAGMMGIGDFSPGSTNATTSGLALDAKLDIDGDLRIRKVGNDDNLEQVLVIDPNDQNRVRYRTIPAGGGVVNAFNGTSVNSGNNQVQLGQWLGVAPAFPAELIKDTEIPLNQKMLFFSDNTPYTDYGRGAVGIGVPTTLAFIPAKLAVLEQIDGIVSDNTAAIYGLNRDQSQTNTIAGVNGRSDRIDNTRNVGGSFKASRANRSFGIVAEADSAALLQGTGGNVGGSFVAGNPFTGDVATSTGVFSLARNSITSNTGGRFSANGVDNTNSIDVGIYAQANFIGSAAIQPTDFAAVLQGNVYVDGVLTEALNLGWSDINLKENIDTIANALDSIKLLIPTQYNFKAQNAGNIHFDNKRHFGFIAQEVETVYPNLVSTTYTGPELDSLGNISHASVPFKALDYTSIIALAVKAIQELDQKVTTQDSLITALNNQLQSCCSYNNERTSPNQSQSQAQTSFQMDVHLNNSTVVYLGQNAPNPFIEHTVINFVVPTEVKQVEMQFFDADGKQIQSINIAQRGSGLLNVYGENLSAGTYTYVLVIDGKVISSKRMLKTN